MQQWSPAAAAFNSRPRCYSDPVDSSSLISSFGDYDGFVERSASETLWEDNLENRLGGGGGGGGGVMGDGSCMYTALSQAMTVSSSSSSCHNQLQLQQQQQRLCENISSSSPSSLSPTTTSPPPYVSSSPMKTSPSATPNYKYTSCSLSAADNNIMHTTLADVFASSSLSAEEQSESCADALLRSSPDSMYGASPGLPDTTVVDQGKITL